MRAGWVLEDVPARLPWMAVLAFVQHLPTDSALSRVQKPEEHLWTLTPHLLAEVIYRLEVLHWIKTKDGQAGRNPPKRMERPGVSNTDKKRLGSGSLPVSEWDAWWNGGR